MSSIFNFRDKNWDIIGKRNYFLAFSAFLLIISIAAIFIRFSNNTLNLGLDFVGGTLCELRFERPVTSEEVRNALDGLLLGDIDMSTSVIQQSQSDNQIVIIRSKYLEQEQIEELYKILEEKLGSFERLGSSGVGPTVGEEVLRNAGIALLIVLVLQLAYITIRFGSNWRYGIAVDLALIHDVIIMVGLYCIMDLEISSPFLAALLTVVGYSVMDSIVIFDRVRENRLLLKKMSFEKLINTSILQTMTRSIYTLLTVLLCLICLILFGGSTLKNFAIALFIGVTFGSYSSIFIASPFVVMWENWHSQQEQEKKSRRREQLAKAKNQPRVQNEEEEEEEDLETVGAVTQPLPEGRSASSGGKKKRKKKR